MGSIITVWILVGLSSGFQWSNSAVPAMVVDRFPTEAECMRVNMAIRSGDSSGRPQPMMCVEAKVVR